MALETIFRKGWGCVKCPDSEQAGFTTKRYLSYLKVPGHENIPDNWQFASEGTYLERHCGSTTLQQLDLAPDKYTGLQMFNQRLTSDYTATSCHLSMPNCAICQQAAPFGCKMCFDHYALVNTTDSAGAPTSACMIDVCPPGTKKQIRYDGFTFCEPC